MKALPTFMVCEHCDAVYRRTLLVPGESVRCEVCAATFHRVGRLDVDRWLALALAAIIVNVLANVCPIMHIGFKGLHNQATLWQSVAALMDGPIALIAVAAALVVIVVPTLQTLLLGWVLWHARSGRRAPGFGIAMTLLVVLRPWGMVEVALIGILVAMIKLAAFLHIDAGAGLWATATSTVLLTLVTAPDTRCLWYLIEVEAGR